MLYDDNQRWSASFATNAFYQAFHMKWFSWYLLRRHRGILKSNSENNGARKWEISLNSVNPWIYITFLSHLKCHMWLLCFISMVLWSLVLLNDHFCYYFGPYPMGCQYTWYWSLASSSTSSCLFRTVPLFTLSLGFIYNRKTPKQEQMWIPEHKNWPKAEGVKCT